MTLRPLRMPTIALSRLTSEMPQCGGPGQRNVWWRSIRRGAIVVGDPLPERQRRDFNVDAI